ncbi:PspC domain-containing protein [Actinokineospora spheciospongiae]|uniref:PspC domain-containing protein n=1 Tax=Actinokineospora spheciospongiae TaxID=909613 RepID=UPI001F46E1E5|nr:PspC domain-containing protein [Actinokineospora spheciospongiae]
MSGKTTEQDSSVEDTLKDFWATRPRRPRRGRKVAGVAAAIGERYRIDPVIARVGFVVAAVFGGAGVVLYLLGWLFFPEEGDETSPAESLLGKGRSSTSQHVTIGLCIALIPAFSWFIDNDATTYIGIAVVAGMLFLLHRNRSHLGTVPTARPEQTTESFESHQVFGATAAQQTADEPAQPTGPPAWDPLGAAPFAWDLPEPSPAAPEQRLPVRRERRSKAGVITLAVVVLAAGVAAAIGPSDAGWFSPRHVVGLLLAVLGLGMVFSSFTRSGRGLIALALPLAGIGIALTVFFPQGIRADGIGEINAKPTTLEEVQAEYRRNIGSLDIDLTALPATGSVTTEVHADVGSVVVRVPENADVAVRCSAGVGTVTCLGATMDGTSPNVDKTDFGADGEGGLKIDLVAGVNGPGDVEVRRG